MNDEKRNEILKLEKIAAHSHPALELLNESDWIIQFAEGYTRRANSVLPGSESNNFEELVSKCENLYQNKNLPCIFKMTDAAPAKLNDYLELRGYKHEADTNVMTVPANSVNFQERCESIIESENTGVIITSTPDEDWLKCFFAFENINDSKSTEIAKRQFNLIDENENFSAVYCRIQIHGVDVAVASAVIENGVAFLLNVVVNEKVRGKGYGKILVKETLEAACNFGAEKLCLQVVADNSVAVKMYESFGFKFLYKYWYMVK